MPSSSSNSVKITSIKPAVILEALNKWVDHISSKYPEILSIGYFGSYATNRFAPGSDLDVLIILQQSEHTRFFDRIPEFYPDSFPIGMEIFAYTVLEIDSMEAGANPWIRHILSETVWVYQRR